MLWCLVRIIGQCVVVRVLIFFFFKQKTAYEMRISDWSSDVCSSDLVADVAFVLGVAERAVKPARHHLRKPDYRVERRPEVMRQAGEELRLQPAPGFGDLLLRLGLRGRLLGDDRRHDESPQMFLHATGFVPDLRHDRSTSTRAGIDRKSTRLKSSH